MPVGATAMNVYTRPNLVAMGNLVIDNVENGH